MIWDSWSDFLAMGGYARYVWGSLLVVLGLMATELLLVRRRARLLRTHYLAGCAADAPTNTRSCP